MSLAAWLLLALTVSVEPPSPEDVIVARALHEKGSEYLQTGAYEQAATLFAELYQRTGDPWALYNRAQAERLAGDCEQAVALYRAFLGTEDLDDRDRYQATKNIERCGGDPTPLPPPALGPHPGAAGDPAIPEPEPEPEPARRTSRRRIENAPPPSPRLDEPLPPPEKKVLADEGPPPRAPVRDPLGWSLAGVGLIGIAAGVPFQIVGGRDASTTVRDGETEAAFVSRVERGRRQSTVGTTLVVAGATFITAAAIRFIVLTTRNGRSRREARGGDSSPMATVARF